MVRRKSRISGHNRLETELTVSLFDISDAARLPTLIWSRHDLDVDLLSTENTGVLCVPSGSIKCGQILEVLFHMGMLPEHYDHVGCIDGLDRLPAADQAVITSSSRFLGNPIEAYLPTGGTFFKDSHAPSGVGYAGAAPDDVAIQSQLLSTASSAVMCCFMGRGAPAGVDWMGAIRRLYSNRKALNRLVYATSFGHERFSSIPGNKIPSQSWEYIMEMISHGEFQRGQATASSFREDFHVRKLDCICGDGTFSQTAYNMYQLVLLWRHVMRENELWDDMPDVNPDTDDAAEKFVEIARSVSMDTYIDAFYEGVPLEDIMA